MLKKIRIQRVSIFDIVATLVLAVVLVAFAVQGTGEYFSDEVVSLE